MSAGAESYDREFSQAFRYWRHRAQTAVTTEEKQLAWRYARLFHARLTRLREAN